MGKRSKIENKIVEMICGSQYHKLTFVMENAICNKRKKEYAKNQSIKIFLVCLSTRVKRLESKKNQAAGMNTQIQQDDYFSKIDIDQDYKQLQQPSQQPEIKQKRQPRKGILYFQIYSPFLIFYNTQSSIIHLSNRYQN
ncbi:hypothetical protein ABPG72_018065 [Tetrahymena utriculariae]